MPIAFITIGQSPRPDIMPALTSFLGGMEVIERGALDDVDIADLASLAADDGDIPLATTAFGREVLVGKRRIMPLLQGAIDRVPARAQDIVLPCIGSFPDVSSPVPLLMPGHLLKQDVASRWPEVAVLGVLAPVQQQMEMNRAMWPLHSISFEVASPYSSPAQIHEAGFRFRQLGIRHIVMNCMGYTSAMRHDLARSSGVDIILPGEVTARALAVLQS